MGGREPAHRPLGRRADHGLLSEEQGVERHGLGQRHTDNGLDQNLAGRTGIAADGFDSLGANHSDTNGCGHATEGALNATCDTCDFCDY